MDVLSGQMDTPSIETHMINPTNAPENIRIPQKKIKPPDSPISAIRRIPDEPNGIRYIKRPHGHAQHWKNRKRQIVSSQPENEKLT